MLIAASAGAMVLSACVSITTTSLPAATDGIPYSAQVSAISSGTTPYTWAITSGTLPAGLELDTAGGLISGIPTGSGNSTFTVTVTDSTGTTASQNLSIAASLGTVRGNAISIANDWEDSYCAVLSTGGVDCWGDNANFGELGDGGTTNADVPVVTGITNAVSVASDGNADYCALLSTGRIDCWGNDQFGQLGDGSTTTTSKVPVAVTGISDAISLDVDNTYNSFGEGYCAVLSTGGVDCWGDNADGELGNGTTTNSNVPVTVTGVSDAVSVTTNANFGSCAVLSTGGVDCWGDNTYGELGDGTTTSSDVPVTVTGVSDAVSVEPDAGFGQSPEYCALLSTGGVDCWGENTDGELGDGTTTTDSDVPVAVSGITDAVSVSSTGIYTNCAVLSTGGVDCWGENPDSNSSEPFNDVPVAVPGITSAANLSGSTCAVLSTGGIDCWGGEASYADWVSIAGINDALTETDGGLDSCAVLSTGGVDCWGDNGDGDLGNGTTTSSAVPVPVTFLGG